MNNNNEHELEDDIKRFHDEAIHLASMSALFFSPIVAFWAISALAGKSVALVLMVSGSYAIMLGIRFFGEEKPYAAAVFWLSMVLCLICTGLYRVDVGQERLKECAVMVESSQCKQNEAGWHCKDSKGMSTNYSANYCSDYINNKR